MTKAMVAPEVPTGPGPSTRPLGFPHLPPPAPTATVSGAFSEVALRVGALAAETWGPSRPVDMVGQHPSYVGLLAKLQKIAAYDEPVLISGESGSGKESMAQALYLLGARRTKPYVVVNCPQYQDGNLTVSELFGHRRGSFTGADADRKGCFETGNGGVIFLDEIADLHMSAQVMLLRALASGEFQPLGSDSTKSVNVRVVAATNRHLDQLIVAQQFRHDLFFRLHYFMLQVPPLRERGDDWLFLLDYRLFRLRQKYGVAKKFSREALDRLASYHWPGNVRQLNSLATSGYAMADGDTIQYDDFESQLEKRAASPEGSLDDLLSRMPADSFWTVVHEPFLKRDLNRSQVRSIIKKGLGACEGRYDRLVETFGMPKTDYQRFMDFLRHHQLKP
ncbi:MAG: sigma 54-interacting transcriptional regulator [Vicinamibacterales bacterium]